MLGRRGQGWNEDELSYESAKTGKGEKERARGLIPPLCAPPPCHYATEHKIVGRLPLPPGNSPGPGVALLVSKYLVGARNKAGSISQRLLEEGKARSQRP